MKLNGDEKSTELLGKLFHIGAENLLDLLPKVFDESMVVTEQNHDKATEAPKINVCEQRIVPSLSKFVFFICKLYDKIFFLHSYENVCAMTLRDLSK